MNKMNLMDKDLHDLEVWAIDQEGRGTDDHL